MIVVTKESAGRTEILSKHADESHAEKTAARLRRANPRETYTVQPLEDALRARREGKPRG